MSQQAPTAVISRSADGNQLIISYMFLRQIVGWIGTLLPIVLLVGVAISSTESRPDSMSGYYYATCATFSSGHCARSASFSGV